MKNVAKFQFEAADSDGDVAEKSFSIVRDWAEEKLLIQPDGQTVIRQSGKFADFAISQEKIDEQILRSMFLRESIEGGSLTTRIRVITVSGCTYFHCTIDIESTLGVVVPSVPLASPRFIRQVISSHPWLTGGSSERVFGRCFISEAEDLQSFVSLLQSLGRRLPLIAVSEFDGETIAGDLHERLAARVCGLAHTVRLSAELSWRITETLGKEWSCFNGATRIYWPLGKGQENFWRHPIWTRDKILLRGNSEKQARDLFVSYLTQLLIEASTFVPDVLHLAEFEEARRRRAVESAIQQAEITGDYKLLADAYALANDGLLAEAAAKDREIADLRENIEALLQASRSTPVEIEIQRQETPPDTVTAAVTIAQERFVNKIEIASESEPDWLDLNPAAGPPEKVLRYLSVLADLSDALAKSSSLGQSIPMWLREKNVDCSVESETSKQSKNATAFRKRFINNEEFDCEFHAKPSNDTSPDMCVRIFFAVAETAPRIRIGYIGRHSE